MNIYIGNFAYDITGDDLQEVFAAFGRVESVKLIRDKFSGDSRGFAFVEMPNKTEAEAAMRTITEIKGRRITINEAKPQVQHSPDYRKNSFSRDKNSSRRERRF